MARHGNPKANPNHVEMSLDQLLSFRPSPSLSGYRTPIGGLFLTGAGTHPGGGVTGVPGRNTAAVVLGHPGRGRRRHGEPGPAAPPPAGPGSRRRPGPAHPPRRRAPVSGPVDPLELATAYQRSAVVAAACASGVADAIAGGPRPAEAVAAACGTSPRATRALLGGMVALGLAGHGPGGYAFSADGAPLASDHPGSVARIVAKEWFFYQAWAGLPESVGDGHARIPPWRDRLAADPGRSLDFLRALDDLAARFGGELPALAGLEGPGRLLDVGGGAGSHAAALARAVPGLEADRARPPGRRAGCASATPSWPSSPATSTGPASAARPAERWDAVLLANILHDHPAGRCQAVVATAAGLLAPGGTLLVYEWLLDDDGDGPPAVALFDLMMLVENEGGAAWTAPQLTTWLAAAGLTGIEARHGAGPIAVLRATAPGPGRRP